MFLTPQPSETPLETEVYAISPTGIMGGGNGKLVWAGFLERAALALLTGSSPGGRGRKALGQESAGSRTWFGRAGRSREPSSAQCH